MAATAARAITRTALRLATAQPILATPEEEAARLAICRACEHYRQTDARCSKCGCHTARLLRKTKLAAEHCPVGKW